jgi:DNA polymerase I
VVFCMGIDSTANFLKCDRAEAKRQLDFYFEQYHRIRPFMDDMISLAGQQGFIWNRYGWKLEVDKRKPYRSINYIVQSSAAAHMKEKMRWLAKYYKAHPEIGAKLVLTIHDEIVTEVEEAKILPHLKTIKAEFEDHHGKWTEFPKLPIEFKVTRERWDKPVKLEVK